MNDFACDRIVICGIGLIGSSLARALKRADRARLPGTAGLGRVIGADRDPAALARARELGVIDEGVLLSDGAGGAMSAGFAAAVASADMIVLAAPVAQTRVLLSALAPHVRADVVLTDVGSTKADVCEAARLALGERAVRFVPAHPIAGGEASGVDAGCEQLFDGRDIVLCPGDDTAQDALHRVDAMWRAAGGRTAVMSPQRHDQIFASVSHLPHLLAFGFIAHILQMEGADERFAFAGSGFRDFSRIAASNPEMWRDICLANREALLSDLDHYLATLAGLRTAIAGNDAATLEQVFASARQARADWQQGETRGERLARRGPLPSVDAIVGVQSGRIQDGIED